MGEYDIRDEIPDNDANDPIAGYGEVERRPRALDDAQEESKREREAGIPDTGTSGRHIGAGPAANEHGNHQTADGCERGHQKYDGSIAGRSADEAAEQAQ